MRKIHSILFPALFVLSWLSSGAQSRCDYRLELYDSFGDGWNGAELSLVVNGVPRPFTFTGGSRADFCVLLAAGDSVRIGYVPGSFEAEVSYALFDAEDHLVFSDGPSPATGEVFAFTAQCDGCYGVLCDDIVVEEVNAFTALLSWQPADPAGKLLIEVDTAGFLPGTGRLHYEASGFRRLLTGLEENTAYELYIAGLCPAGDTSGRVGPVPFHTRWSKDVGVAGILSPSAGCALSAEEPVTVTLANFGGDPQSLIPFNFSVNGIPGGVNQPLDGFFTGVLGKDSLFSITFDAKVDLSTPGPYTIAAWTEFDGDGNLHNDTFSIDLVSIPLIDALPYTEDFEDWSGGWTVAADSENSSWGYGTPEGTVITSAAGGSKAWVTNLKGNYNNNEHSYLLSPCFDLAGLTEDPVLSFDLFLATEASWDGLWVEVSRDGGNSWSKLGKAGSGFQWYNDAEAPQDSLDDWWSGEDVFQGWVRVRHRLDQTAGSPEVRIRLVFDADFTLTREGVGIDNMMLAPALAKDLSTVRIGNTSTAECGADNDSISMTVINFGTAPQTAFQLVYQINGGPPVSESLDSLILAPGGEYTFVFSTPFNSALPGNYEISGWTVLDGEQYPQNDTAVFFYSNLGPGVPYFQDFEGGVFPEDWMAAGDVQVTAGHSNQSFVLFDNLYSADTSFQVTMPAIGLVQPGDSLCFDYRYVDFAGSGQFPATLAAGNSLRILVSVDCGQSYNVLYTIDQTNHVPSTLMKRVSLPLEELAGYAVKVRFAARWASGDYYIDLDNINIKRCPASLLLSAETTGASGPGTADGQASVSAAAGIGPYTYRWDNGATTASTGGLQPGQYSVTVTDRQGCTGQLTVTIDLTVGLQEPKDLIGSVRLSPNPTSGISRLSADFDRQVNATVDLLSPYGTIIRRERQARIDRLNMDLDLQTLPSGIYFIRISTDEGARRTLRLVRSSR